MDIQMQLSNAKLAVSDSVFGADYNEALIHQVVTAYMNAGRAGTKGQKSKAMVRGGGRKPWKQKGTGNARSGSIRSPLWRKGGIIFGPHPRSYRIEVAQQRRLLALRTALYEKARASEISVLESLP